MAEGSLRGELVPLFTQMKRDMATVLDGLAVRALVVELYDNGKVKVKGTNPRDTTTWVISRLASAVVFPGDEVFAIQMKGVPVIVGKVASAVGETARVSVNWADITDPPATYAPDVIGFRWVQAAGVVSNTNNGTIANVGSVNVTLPPGRWGCVAIGTAQFAKSAAAGEAAMQVAVGAVSTTQVTANQTRFPLTTPQLMTATVIRDTANSPINVPTGTVATISLGFRGGPTGTNTNYLQSGQLVGWFYRLP